MGADIEHGHPRAQEAAGEGKLCGFKFTCPKWLSQVVIAE
jgi:hypothetical protein